MSRLLSVLRGHLHFLVVVPALIVVMTYPTIFYVFDTEVFWLPTQVQDVWTKIWNIWYGKLLVTGQAEFLYTDLIFYPEGVSLAYHTFSIPHMLVAGVLESFMPVDKAYNLTFLFFVFGAALSAYVYLLYLFRHKWLSLFGAVIFGCSSYVIGRPSQPDVSIIATIPLSLYFFHRAVLEKRWSLAALSGFLTGVTAFIGIYTYVCLLIALGLFILYFALLRWRHPDFWYRVIAILVIAGSIGMLRVFPMLRDSDSLEHALAKPRGEEFNNDLMQYFVNLDHPFTTPFFREFFGLEIYPRHNTSYLGYIPLALIIFGFTRSAYRRKMLLWLYLMIPFLVLRLGTALTINGQRYEAVVLPKQMLDNLIPSIFTAIYSPDYFYCGALIPLAVLSCYGLLALLRSMSKRLRFSFVVLVILATACEYYVARDDLFLSDQQLAFLDWLAKEDDQASIRLIHVPMGRVNAKLFDFYQTLSAYPHAEGVADRTPSAAYSYINSNLLLGTWIASESIQCQVKNESQYLAAIDALARDGFSHVVMHRKLWNSPYVADSFLYAHASYQDDFSAIFRLSDLRHSCPKHRPGRAGRDG